MKKTRLFTSLIVIVMMMALGASSAFAAADYQGSDFDDIKYKIVKGDDGADTDIPVYGFISEDVDGILDDDSEDEGEQPYLDTYAINVEVPVKLIWAAFEGDEGDITAPDYHITNLSRANDLTVTMTDFVIKDEDSDATTIDSDLTLNITGTQMALADVVGMTSRTDAYATTLFKRVDLSTANTWNFSLGGTWDGDWSTTYTPQYTMTLKFEVKL
ncbi:MAG: hypothetical protein LBL36_02875 [Clostridiales Family XIII bacterium]|jgi:hypothetical protein|nr:hypothetical protein [Clostridiales Family XIII bacterium]